MPSTYGARAHRAVPAIIMVTLWGCAGTHSARHDHLLREYRKLAPATHAAERFEADGSLVRVQLLREVAAVNPGLEAARQAIRAALARPAQMDTLDDPMLSYGFAPGTIFADHADFGQTIGISQRLPWPGKLSLQGEVALAEAEARREDYEALRRRLLTLASTLYDDHYAVARALEINAEHAELLERFRLGAEARYASGQGSSHEPLQAEVELAHLERERVVLEVRQRMLVARINGLLHRAPDAPLPPPPEVLAPAEPMDAVDAALRPELSAADRRIGGAERAVELAERRYYPDFTLNGSYSSMWAADSHRFMLGAAINLPLQLGGRDAAVEEARAHLAQATHERERLADELSVELEHARLGAGEAVQVAGIYRDRLVPTARAQVDAAFADYEAGRGSFLALIDAERNLRRVRLAEHDTIAETHRRRAALILARGLDPLNPEAAP